ncbi:MAG: alpha/beta-hydrolase family protein [Actinomycetia bacterium]|nr:alpha/beta-hydrolase family protein [Actinomycetes bacterium]
MSRYDTVSNVVLKVTDRFNPLLGGPAGPLKTRAIFASYAPSLMPRPSINQGFATAFSVLAAELVGLGVNGAINRAVPRSSPYFVRVGARAVVTAAGLAISRIPEADDETTTKASVRSAGRLLAVGAVGGAINESVLELQKKLPPKSNVRPIILGAAAIAGALYHSKELIAQREAVIKPWTEDEKRAALGPSLAIGFGVTMLGNGIGRSFVASRSGFIWFFGDDPAHATVAKVVNATIWAAGSYALYLSGVSFIARKNEEMEPAYSKVPDNPYVSGGTKSKSPFDELGLQGRRFVTDVVTPDDIESTLGEPAIAHPIRAFVGVNSEPLYPSGRSEMMLDELERLGAFDRKYLLLVSPTGTGWVDQTMIESMELLTRGDVASACVQYSRGPSFLEVQKVHLGAAQFRGVLWGVRNRLLGMPEDKRPRVFVFGESLGSWSSSDVLMHQGIEGFDHYGIDHALWFGLVGLAKWSKTGMRQGSTDLVPEGTVEAFDNFDEYMALTEEERHKLRAVVVDHDNDPIAQMSFRWAVKRPPWLTGEARGRNVPEGMDWVPLITFVQIMVDAMNAMRTVPGKFHSFGHDYRGDTQQFVQAAFHLPSTTEEQDKAVHETLVRLELERGERIKNAVHEADSDGETLKRTKRPPLVRYGRQIDPEDAAISITPGDAPADYQ